MDDGNKNTLLFISDGGKTGTQDQIIFIKHSCHFDLECLHMLYDYWTNNSIPEGTDPNTPCPQPLKETRLWMLWYWRDEIFSRVSTTFQDLNRIADADMRCPKPITQHLISSFFCSMCDKLNRGFRIVVRKKKTVFCSMFDPLFFQSSAKYKTHYVGF